MRVVRLGCGERTNPIQRCFVNPERMNCGELLVGMVYEFVEQAISLRLSIELLSRDLSGAWVTVRGESHLGQVHLHRIRHGVMPP
jgi:hypothetical protein